MLKHEPSFKTVSSLHDFLCTILPLQKILQTAVISNGPLLGIAYKSISGGAVVGRLAAGRGKNIQYTSCDQGLDLFFDAQEDVKMLLVLWIEELEGLFSLGRDKRVHLAVIMSDCYSCKKNGVRGRELHGEKKYFSKKRFGK